MDDDLDDFSETFGVKSTPNVKDVLLSENGSKQARIMAKNTDIPSEKTRISPDKSLRKIVPETAPNTTKGVVEDELDDFDSEPNPFAFNVKKTPNLHSTVIENKSLFVSDSPDELSDEEECNKTKKCDETSRFLKAAANSQESNYEECLQSADFEDDCRMDKSTEDVTIKLVSLQTPRDVSLEEDVVPSYANNNALISEEFPLIAKNHGRIIDGWLTTTVQVSF